MKQHKGYKNIVVSLIIIGILTYTFIMKMPSLSILVRYTSGGSMLPTLGDHHIELSVTSANLLNNIKRGTIVGIKGIVPKANTSAGKRIIGLPGDHIQINKDTYDVYINGELYNEYSGCHNITKDITTYKFTYPDGYEVKYLLGDIIYTDVVLGEDEYFAMGDNRAFSYDSKLTGPVKKFDIISLSYGPYLLNDTISNYIKSYFEIYYKYLISQSDTLKWGENYKPIALESDNDSIRIKHFINEDTGEIYYQNDIYDIREKRMR